MEALALAGLMYVAVGVGLYAQPRPGAAVPGDFTPLRQAEIFWTTLPAVLAWPAKLLRS